LFKKAYLSCSSGGRSPMSAAAAAVLAASVFHFGEISIPQAKQYLKEKGISVEI